MFGTINFENGALGQWVYHHAGHGEPLRAPHGLWHARLDRRSRRPQRTPGPPDARRRNRCRGRAHPRLRAELPSCPRSPPSSSAASGSGPTTSTSPRPTARSSRSNTTSLPSASSTGARPEVDGAVAKRAIAMVYAPVRIHRSRGRPVTIEEVEVGRGRRLSARDRQAPRPGYGLLGVRLRPTFGRAQTS